MKIITENENYIIYIKKTNLKFDIKDKEEIEKNIKDIILDIRNKKHINITGFYKVKVYQNNKFGLILEMHKEDDIDFFKDFIDLKVVIFNNSKIYLKINDYFKVKDYKDIYYYDNNFYLDIDFLEDKDIIALSEFFDIIYGDKKNQIKTYLKKIK